MNGGDRRLERLLLQVFNTAILPVLKPSKFEDLSSQMATTSRPIKTRALPADSRSFCLKILTADDLRNGKELPETAVTEYGNCMADYILLRVPNCGTYWPVEVKRSTRGGRMWLHKGWPEFANFYSLEQGYLALFSYEGEHSHFQARIFHWNDMEINYPIRGSAGFDGRPKRKANRDMPPVYLEARAGSISSGSSADEHQNDLSSFKSDKPFLMLKMTSTYIQRSGVHINASFAKEHLCKPGTSCDVTLQISSERFWIAQCSVSENSGHRIYARVTGAGWKAFKEDNCLEERDVCVFEVIEERTLKVSIFRAKVKIHGQNEAKFIF